MEIVGIMLGKNAFCPEACFGSAVFKPCLPQRDILDDEMHICSHFSALFFMFFTFLHVLYFSSFSSFFCTVLHFSPLFSTFLIFFTFLNEVTQREGEAQQDMRNVTFMIL